MSEIKYHVQSIDLTFIIDGQECKGRFVGRAMMSPQQFESFKSKKLMEVIPPTGFFRMEKPISLEELAGQDEEMKVLLNEIKQEEKNAANTD